MKVKLGLLTYLLVAVCIFLFMKSFSPLLHGAVIALFLLRNAIGEKRAEIAAVCILPFMSLTFLGFLILFTIPGFLLSFRFRGGLNLFERVLMGFPLSLLFFLPVQLLSLLGVSLGPIAVILLQVIVPIALAIPIREHIVSSLDKSKYDTKAAISILLVFIFTLAVWSPIINSERIGMTAAGGYFAQASKLEQGIAEYGEIPIWDAGQDLGWAVFTFDPITYYYSIALTDFISPSSPLTYDFNFISFISLFYLGAGLYLLSKRLGFSDIPSLFPAFFFLANPYLPRLGVLTGYSKTLVALSIAPLFLIAVLSSLKKPGGSQQGSSNSENFILSAILLAALFYIHPLPATHIGFIAVILYAMWTIRNKKLPASKEIKHIILAVGLFALLIGVWAVPMSLHTGYLSPTKGYNFEFKYKQFRGYWGQFFAEPVAAEADVNAGLYFTLLSLAGVGALAVKKGKTRELVWMLFLAQFLLVLLFALPGPQYEVLKKLNDIEKVKFMSIMMMGMAIPGVFSFSKKKEVVAVVAIILLGFAAYYGDISNDRINEWYRETGQTGVYSDSMDYIRSAEYGRVMTYGMYEGVVGPMFPFLSGKPHVGASQPLNQHSDVFFAKTFSEDTKGMPDGATTEYVLNILRQSFTKHLLVLSCTPGGVDVIMRLSAENAGEVEFLNPGYCPAELGESHGMYVISLPSGGFAEKVSLGDLKLEEKEIYDNPGAYKVVGIDENLGTYSGQAAQYDYTLSSAGQIAALPEPQEIDYRRDGDRHITLAGDFNRGDWIFVKEQYFPRWHAYSGAEGSGQSAQNELRIFMSNIGLMVIEVAQDTDEIQLINSPHNYELLLSLLATLALFAAFAVCSLPHFLDKKRTS